MLLASLNIYSKIWGINHILCNIGLLMLIYNSSIILTLIGCMVVVMVNVIIDIYLNYKEIRKNGSMQEQEEHQSQSEQI